MKELLAAGGWTLYHSCMCGGSRKELYLNNNFPGVNIGIRPTRNVAWITKNNHMIAGKFNGYLLESKMKEHGL